MPALIANFTDARADELKRFLAAPERPEGTMDYFTLTGFLFAVGYSPEVILPSDWLPVVFDNQDPNYRSERELQEIVGALLSLYNYIAQEASEDKVHLPPGCHIHDDPVANFDPAPLSRWAAGFDFGRLWLEDSWKACLPDEMEEELNTCVLILSFFADRQFAEEFFEEARHDGVSTLEDKSFEEFVARILRLLPAAMENYAAMGLSLFQSLMKLGLYEKAFMDDEPEPGRNDPCPCGSGRKFKRCCMV
ncbi:MAG: UPF0149 family protein [Thermoleophilia bacterium]|nr:UPF0149 family protein [Thermoleophilia bacterium]